MYGKVLCWADTGYVGITHLYLHSRKLMKEKPTPCAYVRDEQDSRALVSKRRYAAHGIDRRKVFLYECALSSSKKAFFAPTHPKNLLS